MILRSDENKLSYLIYEIMVDNVSMFEITPKAKYLPWDKISRDEWDSDIYGVWNKLEISNNRFDMHDAVRVVFTRMTRLE